MFKSQKRTTSISAGCLVIMVSNAISPASGLLQGTFLGIGVTVFSSLINVLLLAPECWENEFMS